MMTRMEESAELRERESEDAGWTYREVSDIDIPRPANAVERWGYIGHELEAGRKTTDPVNHAISLLTCGGCGSEGVLTRQIRAGMTCPACKSDTLEESLEQRDRELQRRR
jgi:predicted Zn-ribbon and HTH transcriptional regulator